MSVLSTEDRRRLFQQWEKEEQEIEQLYKSKNREVHNRMQHAIQNYETIVSSKGTVFNEAQQREEFVLEPLNGQERLAFIKSRITSHYAHIQLAMLYKELRKKIARIETMEKAKKNASQSN